MKGESEVNNIEGNQNVYENDRKLIKAVYLPHVLFIMLLPSMVVLLLYQALIFTFFIYINDCGYFCTVNEHIKYFSRHLIDSTFSKVGVYHLITLSDQKTLSDQYRSPKWDFNQ